MGQYLGGMGDSNEEPWANYNVYDFQLPCEEELRHMKAIIIPGSVYSVNDENISWIPLLIRFIRNVHENHPHVKLVGICFGSQIIAKALGGTVGDVEDSGIPNLKLFIGKEQIQLDSCFYKQDFFRYEIDGLIRECIANSDGELDKKRAWRIV